MNGKITGFFIYFLFLSLCLSVFFPLNEVSAFEGEKSEILVKFKSGNWELVEVLEGDIKAAVADYEKRFDIAYVEPNYIYRSSLTPSDAYYDEQWYLKKIRADKAWDKTQDASEVIIAVIDSGVYVKHPDLTPSIWINEGEIPDNGIDDDKNGFMDDYYGWDFIDNIPDPSPKFKEEFTEEGVVHGTVVAGVAAAAGNNASGVTGIAWNAKVMSLRALDDKGEGKTSNVVRAIDYAINNRADIINFSFVGFDYSQALHEAIERAHRAGIIMVAAAGNEQDDGVGYNLDQIPMYPACHDGDNGENMVIGVAATDTFDQKADFSSYGFSCVDITAPGVSVFSTVPYQPNKNLGPKYFNKYFDGYWSGTSMATPMVVGAIALIEGVNRELGASEVKEVLLGSAENISRLNPGYLGRLGSGRLDVYKAVSEAISRLGQFHSEIITVPNSKRPSKVEKRDIKGSVRADFSAYADNFLGGAEIAAGDVDGDGHEEIIVGAGNGGGPHIRIFNRQGELEGQFFAYNENFRGGVNVAVGDVDGDGQDEIIAGAGFGGGPQIRIFDNHGRLWGQFFAYNENFRGGVNVATGDVDGDGRDEIIAGAGFGGGPQVRIFNNHAKLEGQFFAYNENFRGGVNVAVADIDGGAARNREEIITAPGRSGGPHIRVFDSGGRVKNQFFAYNESFRGGVSLATGDMDGDGLSELITGAGPGGAPHVRVFKPAGALIGSFYAYESDFTGGVNVGTVRMLND